MKDEISEILQPEFSTDPKEKIFKENHLCLQLNSSNQGDWVVDHSRKHSLKNPEGKQQISLNHIITPSNLVSST